MLFDEEGVHVIPFQVSHPNFITHQKITSSSVHIHADQASESLTGKIVLIENADPGYDWIFSKNISAKAICPSGASTGTFEAYEKRDFNNNKYLGKSVYKAIDLINKKISKKLKNQNIHNQSKIDHSMIKLDGSKQKNNLGANSILAVSMAVKKLSAKIRKIPLYKSFIVKKNYKLPYPLMNIINGGAHANNGLRIQEFMIRPDKAKSFVEGVRICFLVINSLRSLIKKMGHSTSVGDEGGFAPKLNGTEDALETIKKAVTNAGYSFGKDVMIALDCAASEFYENGKYDYTKFEGLAGEVRDSKAQADYLSDLADKYPIISIEDGMDENDWEGWKYLTEKIGSKVQLVGDDLFVTNVERLSRGIKESIGNSILIKVNQIGTLSETIDAVSMAHDAGYTTIMSHRSGETEDTTIADLSVALSTGQIKTGSASRSDRMSKYNQLLRIEEELSDKAVYPQMAAFKIS